MSQNTLKTLTNQADWRASFNKAERDAIIAQCHVEDLKQPFVNEYFTYEANLCPDGYPYMNFDVKDGSEPGFFFSLTGIPE